MGIDENILKEIVRRICRLSQPDQIILFGSAATEQMTSDSDIDILVLETHPNNPFGESVRIGNALRGLGFAFDVIVMATERFNESKDIIGGIAYPAHKYGKVIYAAA